MKMVKMLAAAAVLAGTLSGCAYSGVAASGDKVIVARNDAFLFGLLRKVYVCKVTETGLTQCSSGEAP
jgi:hypothetical protein